MIVLRNAPCSKKVSSEIFHSDEVWLIENTENQPIKRIFWHSYLRTSAYFVEHCKRWEKDAWWLKSASEERKSKNILLPYYSPPACRKLLCNGARNPTSLQSSRIAYVSNIFSLEYYCAVAFVWLLQQRPSLKRRRFFILRSKSLQPFFCTFSTYTPFRSWKNRWGRNHSEICQSVNVSSEKSLKKILQTDLVAV